jgi:hypothetical protein
MDEVKHTKEEYAEYTERYIRRRLDEISEQWKCEVGILKHLMGSTLKRLEGCKEVYDGYEAIIDTQKGVKDEYGVLYDLYHEKLVLEGILDKLNPAEGTDNDQQGNP